MRKQGNSSYACTDVGQLTDHLFAQGYTFREPRAPTEHTRMVKGASLLVLYNNGTVLLQGADTESPRPLLEAFHPVAEQIDLPF